MRKMIVAAIVLMSISRTEAQEIKIDIPVDKALQQIGNGVDYIINKVDIVNDRSRRESVAVLALHLASLSGEEIALARSLEVYVNDPNNPNAALFSDPILAEDAISILDNHINNIKSSFLDIQRHMKDIDPNWALHNVSIVQEIGSFAYDGKLWYVTSFGRLPLTDQMFVDSLIRDLNDEADQFEKLASRLKQHIALITPPQQ